METVENNSASSTHQEKAKKLRKLRRWQVVISLLGIGVMIWGVSSKPRASIWPPYKTGSFGRPGFLKAR